MAQKGVGFSHRVEEAAVSCLDVCDGGREAVCCKGLNVGREGQTLLVGPAALHLSVRTSPDKTIRFCESTLPMKLSDRTHVAGVPLAVAGRVDLGHLGVRARNQRGCSG